MRVLLGSITYPLPNGVTSSINVTLDALKAAGHEAMVVAPEYEGQPSRPEHRPLNSTVIAQILTGPLGNNERFFGLGASPELKKIIREFRPQIFWLHTMTWATNAFERLMLRQREPKILTYHTMVDEYARNYGGEIARQQLVNRTLKLTRKIDAIIAPTAYIKSHLEQMGVTARIEVIPSATGRPTAPYLTKAEFCQRFKINPTAKVLLHVGRLVKEKNIDTLLNVLKLISHQHPDIMLVCLGPGDVEGFTNKARELNIKKQVLFVGEQTSAIARASYGAADLFVFASQMETQGLVVSEAMQAGLPVVALASPVTNEVYPPGTAAVAYYDGEMAALISELLNDEQQRQRLSAAGKKFVEEHFSPAGVTQKQINLLTELIGE